MIKISYNPAIALTDFDAKVKTVCSNVGKFCKQGYCGNGTKIAVATAVARYNAMDAIAKATFDRYAGANWQQLAEVKMPKFVFSKETLDVLNFFNDNNQDELKKALDCKATDFLVVVNDIEKKFKQLRQDRKLEKEQRSQAYHVLYYIFVDRGYGELKRKAKVAFYKATGLSVCPYCNASEIELYRKKGEDHVTGQLDHFHPKEYYPYLAMSKYNLVPSCSRCNGEGCKHNRDYLRKKLQNPYLLADNDGVFFRSSIPKGKKLKADNLDKLIVINLDLTKNPLLEKNRSTFNWLTLYRREKCRKIAVKIRETAQAFCNGAYHDQAMQMFDGTKMQTYVKPAAKDFYEDVGSTLNENEYLSEPYSKLRHDIFFDYCDQINFQPVLPPIKMRL